VVLGVSWALHRVAEKTVYNYFPGTPKAKRQPAVDVLELSTFEQATLTAAASAKGTRSPGS
jgi:hypothetical protein